MEQSDNTNQLSEVESMQAQIDNLSEAVQLLIEEVRRLRKIAEVSSEERRLKLAMEATEKAIDLAIKAKNTALIGGEDGKLRSLLCVK